MKLNFLKNNKIPDISEKFNISKKKKKIPPFLLFMFDLFKLVIIAFIIVWPIHKFVFQPFYVIGPSMEPNFYNKDYLIIDKFSYHFDKPERGEVVIFHSPNNEINYLIKRVIGLPGERVLIKNDEVKIYNNANTNGFTLEENYLNAGTQTRGKIDVKLSPGEYYVLGDNRNMSLDSRSFGPIKSESIIGNAWIRGWPFKEAGFIKNK